VHAPVPHFKHRRLYRWLGLVGAILTLTSPRAFAQPEASVAATTQPTEPSAESAPSTQPAPAERSGYYTSRSIGTTPATDPPAYAQRASELAEWFGAKDAASLSWLDVGIEHMTRYEHRQNFYPAGNTNDNRFLMRNRGYLGLREIADPFRLALEFQDARAFGNDFPETTADVDEADILQAYGELYLQDTFGANNPLSVRAGRQSFDLVNRRLVARNGFRNTINAFDGLRVRAGDETTPWEVNVIAMKPVERFARQFNHPDDERWFYGLTGDIRFLDPAILFKPYYFVLDTDRKGFNRYDREVHTVGLNAFGLLGDSGFDYDLDGAWQFGKSERRNHRAFAAHGELGYTFEHEWDPRLAAFVDYGSGDRHPFDHTNERFDSLFVAAHPFYAPTDMFTRENLIQPGLRWTVKPLKTLTIESFYRTYWLASDSDTWAPANVRAIYGRNGDFLGHGLDIIATLQLTQRWSIEIGYSHLTAGEFIQNLPNGDDADFFYVQTTLRL